MWADEEKQKDDDELVYREEGKRGLKLFRRIISAG